ncbi:hypothetical protein CANCADRAFT_122059 [Tortispora caseinolytica NRRL Y-17796]|uniref:Aldehyde dehydrogenase domain-containing protein n=1 Tax=Tortispora caseinolytica NRRL Y-17796 TaxID=767744 RepID=A0A1E4THN4_9ASCO|nr:hypothetical protein CANCADRAFT_122059 [Tortispora caseinolytica NRRL Y-17796]
MSHLNVAEEIFRPKLLIDGAWIEKDTKFDVIDPGTENVWAQVSTATVDDVEAAVAAAEKAFATYSQIPGRERGKMILKWDELIRKYKPDIARLISLETGKPFHESIAELDYALTFTWWMAGEAERQHGSTMEGALPGNRFVVIKKPIGVVACLMPWNFPVALACRKIATALAAGCTVVAKPSPETPLSTLAVAHLLELAGFPPGVVNVLPTDNANTPPIGEALCRHPVVQKVSFTGSTAVGKLLASQCAGTLKKLTLELGGNGAFIVFPDSDLEKAATWLMACKFRNAGQVCVTAQRVFVHSSVLDEFADLMKGKIEALKQGPAFEEGVTLGPVTTKRSVEKIHRHVQNAVSNGATVITGGSPNTSLKGFFFQPTLLKGMTDTMTISCEETFGPVVALYSFETEKEVVERANNTSMGLTSYLFTKDADRIWRIMEKLEVGNVGINTGMTTSAEAPFGGWHDSGYGKEAGKEYGISEYLKIKSATWKVDFEGSS